MTTTSDTRYKGIIPPLITPLKGRDELDGEGLERLIEHVLAGGVHGLFILGTTGEAPSLSYRLRRELIERVCRQVNGRAPVLTGVTDTAFEESVALARHAADAGSDALVITTPYYFPAGQTELKAYTRHLIRELPLPLMLYNMPGLTKVWFEIETLRALSDEERIIGLKDSSGDLDYFGKALALRDGVRSDWSVLLGPEAKLPEGLRLGCDGGVTGGANAIPGIFVDCYEAFVAGDEARLTQAHERILAYQELYEIGKYASRLIKATKCTLSLMGICEDHLAEPFHHFKAPERARVREILERSFPELLGA